MLQLRRMFLPHTASDIGCFLLIFTFIPITFVFEMAVVLPEFHDTGGFFYIFTWIAGLFLLFNLKSNMLACMLVDTSIKSLVLTPPTEMPQRKMWRLCADCETLAPPRSWHCQVCNTCILKRDHHCLFTGCCIGHRNHRYFLYFILYLAIGSAYTTAYNSVYFWFLHGDVYLSTSTAIKMIFPMFYLILDVSWRNFYLLIYELNIIALAYSVVLLLYHLPTVLRGGVAYERKTSILYDLGDWRQNMKMILGERMHLTWLSPFIKSELPHDGIHWESVLLRTGKSR